LIKKRLSRAASIVTVLAAALSPSSLRADCGVPLTYFLSVNGATVQVCPTDGGCSPDGLLRVDSVGNVVLITTCDGQCYVDECVPPGQYEYGGKTPFSCSSLGDRCGASYFVTADLSASTEGCQRTLPAPTVYTGGLPWGASPNIRCSSGGGCGSSGSGPVLGINAVVLVVGLFLWRARSRRVSRAA
jgi:hypothetical protein